MAERNYCVMSMSQGETRRKIMELLKFPMSVGDVRIALGIKYETAKENLEWLFEVGAVHKSYEMNGKMLFHKAEFQHPPLFQHITTQEIMAKKETEKGEGNKTSVADNEQANLEDAPVSLDIPEGETEFERVIEEDENGGE